MRRRSLFAGLFGAAAPVPVPLGRAALPAIQTLLRDLRPCAAAAARLDARKRWWAEYGLEEVYRDRLPPAVLAEGYRYGDGLASLLRNAEAALARASSSGAIMRGMPWAVRPSIPSASEASAASADAMLAGGPAWSAATSAVSMAASRAHSALNEISGIGSPVGGVAIPMVEAGGAGRQRRAPCVGVSLHGRVS